VFDSYVFKALVGAAIGAAIGIAYARLTRCSTGACPLTSNLWTAGLIGAMFGLWLAAGSGAANGRTDANRDAYNAGVAEKSPVPPVSTADTQEAKRMAKQIESLEQFENEVLKADKPVLVDFHATWCGPCKFLAPIMDELSQALDGRAEVVKIDIDKFSELAARYGIQAVPTVIVFHGGEVVSRFVGVRAKDDYLAAVEPLVRAGT